MRKEIAEYYTSVHRCDEVVGAVLQALHDAGQDDHTIVMFLSDHGMALPFAKTNCYRHSTHTPWMVRWPGVVQPGATDATHFISGIDFTPTILQAAGLSALPDLDGRSFLPLLRGEKQTGRDAVFTTFHKTAGKKAYPMRAIFEGDMAYIFNAWADGKTIFRNESQSGRTFKAMRAAAQTNEEIAARVKLFQYRVAEEVFDYAADPDALQNLSNRPTYAAKIQQLRSRLLAHLRDVKDPLAADFERYLEQQ